MPYQKFDRNLLDVKKLNDRKNKIFIEKSHVPVTQQPAAFSESENELIKKTAGRIRLARERNRAVILTFGAHTIKNGMSPTLIELMEQGWVTHLATNGAGIIHDWEFAYQGQSSEDVRENVNLGQFGIWDKTGFYINLALIAGAWEGLGYGESVGKMISLEGLELPEISYLENEVIRLIKSDPDRAAAAADFAGSIKKFSLMPGFMSIPHPYKKYSAQARAYELKIPFTGHPMIGHDIIYNHPMNHGAAIGRTALNDFLCFTNSVSNIDYGVYMSVGSAVMSPMIFEKALSMAQNIMIQENKHIDNHFIIVVDLVKAEWDWQKNGEPPMDHPAYYLRYCKTFNRMGGEMHYLTADNRDFLLALYQELKPFSHGS
jgi:hypothetical protein